MEYYSIKKPPTGIPPEIFHKEQRLRDLSSAISTYINEVFFEGDCAVTVSLWCDELSRRLKEFR